MTCTSRALVAVRVRNGRVSVPNAVKVYLAERRRTKTAAQSGFLSFDEPLRTAANVPWMCHGRVRPGQAGGGAHRRWRCVSSWALPRMRGYVVARSYGEALPGMVGDTTSGAGPSERNKMRPPHLLQGAAGGAGGGATGVRLARDAAVGGAAGLLASKLMSPVTSKLYELQSEETKKREQEVSYGVAYMVAARKTAKWWASSSATSRPRRSARRFTTGWGWRGPRCTSGCAARGACARRGFLPQISPTCGGTQPPVWLCPHPPPRPPATPWTSTAGCGPLPLRARPATGACAGRRPIADVRPRRGRERRWWKAAGRRGSRRGAIRE
jgi:hypothetical protein